MDFRNLNGQTAFDPAHAFSLLMVTSRISAFLVSLLTLFPVLAGAQSASVRNFEDIDGQTFRGKLVGFKGPNFVEMRMADGRIVVLPDNGFSRYDMAWVLLERLKHQMEGRYSGDLHANTFHHRRLPKGGKRNVTSIYMGMDEQRVWAHLQMIHNGAPFGAAGQVIFEGGGVRVAIPYDSGRKVSGSGWERLDVDLVPYWNELRGVLVSSTFKIFLDTGQVREVGMSPEERAAMLEMFIFYDRLYSLASDRTWWQLYSVNTMGSKTAGTPLSRRLQRYEEPNHHPLIGNRDWVNPIGQEVNASLQGFYQRHAVLRKAGGETLQVPITGFNMEDQQALLNLRLDEHFTAVNPEGFPGTLYWPRSWKATLGETAFLFAEDLEGKPALFFYHFGARNLLYVKGDNQLQDWALNAETANPLPIKGQTCLLILIPSSRMDETVQLLDASKIHYRFEQRSGMFSGEFSPETVLLSQESISCYLWLKLLNDSK